MQRIGLFLHRRDQSVPRFVVRGDGLLLFRDDHTLTLAAHQDFIFGVFKVLHLHFFLSLAGSVQSSLVHHVCDIGAGETRCGTGQYFQVDILGSGDVSEVNLQDLFPALDIRCGDDDSTVETTGSQQSRVQNVGPVGGGDNDHPFIGVKTIHFHQQLVQGLFPFVVSAAEAGASLPSHRIDLIDKDQTRSVLLALFEQIPDSGSADTHKQLDKV